ncbi:MAG: S-layer homology domain-containing protein [Clostridiales bacterium]|jgi:hypothetical protein|nr:S-layer homology domain-containing protein [Eubacteriales bacterium]MDH7566702.1 S-layer homology domain-containing protein [Clostridiales bacterium]
MKRKLAVFMTVIWVVGVFGTGVFAQTGGTPASAGNIKAEESSKNGQELERIIELVKLKVDVPAEYEEFTSSVNGEGKDTLYRLQWSSSTLYAGKSGGRLEVAVDGYGNIIEYNNYRYGGEYSYQRRLPKITKGKALDVSRKFIYQMCPDIVEQVAIDAGGGNYSIDYDGSYRFYFYRQYRGVPFYENGVSVLVNGNTGEIVYFNRSWTKGLIFPDPAGAIGMEAAKTAYKEKIGLSLNYGRTYGRDRDRTYLQYSPGILQTNMCIDALTGEKVFNNGGYSPYLDMGYGSDSYRGDLVRTKRETPVPEQQLNRILQSEGLVSVERAEKLARSIPEFGIDDTCLLGSYGYSRYEDSGAYALRLDFIRPPSKDDWGGDIPEEKLRAMMDKETQTFSVTLNAKTLELISFNTYKYDTGGEKSGPDKADVKKLTEEFLGKYKAEKFSQVRLLDGGNQTTKYMEKYGVWTSRPSDSFIYLRQINGIPFEDNRLIVNFDSGTGKLLHYSENWDDMDFIPADHVLGQERAYEILFRDIGLELKFISSGTTAEKAPDSAAGKIRLVYDTVVKKPACIDAQKGTVIDYSGEPFTGGRELRYKDIESHSAREQITALAEIGVAFNGDSFRPEEVIVQKDLLYLLGKMKGNLAVYGTSPELSRKELDGMYRTMINDDVMDEEEKNPDGEVTREEGVKYLLRAAGYKKFAELEGLFNCDFADRSEINPKLVGYAAIAKALKIVEGDSFMPKAGLTRAEAAKMIYNYLKR